jgi:hypothetical protein
MAYDGDYRRYWTKAAIIDAGENAGVARDQNVPAFFNTGLGRGGARRNRTS